MTADLDPYGYLDEDGDAFRIDLPSVLPDITESGIALRWWTRRDLNWRVDTIAGNRAWLLPHFAWAYEHTRDIERDWIASMSEQRRNGTFHYAIEIRGLTVGALTIRVDPPTPGGGLYVTPSAEVTYWIAREHAGNGFASAALHTATQFAHDHGVRVCYLLIDPANVASMRAAMNAGYAVDHPATGLGEHVLMSHQR